MSEMKSSDLDLSAKRQALAALLRGQESSSPGTKRIQRRNEPGLVPLAFAQERLWFLEQYYPETSLYNIPAAYPFQGPLNVDALRASLNDLVRRHESLRTTFISKDGKPLQFIAPELVLDVPLIDFSQFSEEQRQHEAAKLMGEQGAKPFDLSQGPLLRATL
ncbi:MAG TPA: condensation domain-containing protein, partial [Pyrinomonadaceae bacterium]|nr:condensation domain-containing protein [Pyrinomonadaceae bacterium]